MIYNENLLKEIKVGKIQFILVEDFLAKLKREFEKRDNEPTKVAKLKIEQDGKNRRVCAEVQHDNERKQIRGRIQEKNK